MKLLSVGILVNSNLVVPEWLYCTLQKLVCDNKIEIKAIVVNEKSTLKFSAIDKIKAVPYAALMKLDNIIFARHSTCFQLHDIKKIANEHTREIYAKVNRNGVFEEFDEKTIHLIQNCDLDILIRSGFRILKGNILTSCSKYGVWSFHHGDNKKYRGMPAAFWEVYLNEDTISAILQILKPELDNGKVIGKVKCNVIKHSFSLTQTGLYQQASVLLSSRICFLQNYGWEKFQKEYNVERISNLYVFPLRKTPDTITAIKAFSKHILKWVKIKSHLFKIDKPRWVIGYSEQIGLDISLHRFKYLIPPKNVFWADPFIINHHDKTYIFFEESQLIGKGHISMFEYRNKEFVNYSMVLKENFHLSYPFVFMHQGEMMMIPETKSIREIRLYRWTNGKFEYTRTLISNIKAVDSTLLFHDGKYWLFCALAPEKNEIANELHIFYSNKLEDEFVPHPKNPVKIDVESSRPAGGIFLTNNELIRPTQDGSKTYGYAIRFMKINKITVTEYEEADIDMLTPTWKNNISAVHTFNQSDKLTVIDVYGKF